MKENPAMILVTGATGTVGRALLDRLLASGQTVRAMSRRPEGADLPAAVHVVGADLGDPSTLPNALDGVERVFLLSRGPDGPQHDAHLSAAARDAGVTLIVKLSALNVGDETSHDPITTWHRAGEQAVRDSGVAWTCLRPTGFMSNALMWTDTVASHDTVYTPYGAGRTAVIDPDDIAAVAAAVLTTPGDGHAHQAYPLTGPEALSPAVQVDILAEVLGRPLRYIDVAPQTAHQAMTEAGMPAEAVLALLATSLEPDAATVHPTVKKITRRTAGTFRDWARRHQSAFTPSWASR